MGKYKTTIGVNSLAFIRLNIWKKKLKKKYSIDSLPNTKLLSLLMVELGAKEERIKFIFVQSQFNEDIAKSMAREIGATVISIDPLAEDYIDNLESIAKIITESLR